MLPNLPSLSFSPDPDRPAVSGPWSGHRPFACDLVAALKPGLLVELGTYAGDSYLTFCESIAKHGLSTLCFAVDTWQGDPHSGFYGDEIYSALRAHHERYGTFSHLLRMSFDEASSRFADSSIDLLHIDGFHTYEEAKRDFEQWIGKVKPGGAILIHDVAVRRRDFGVWRLWEELAATYPTFQFLHSCGLGVLVKPPLANDFLVELMAADAARQAQIRRYYSLCSLPDSNSLFAETRVQVFYCLGDDYREADSSSVYVESGQWTRVSMELPAGVGKKALRLDPSDKPAVVEIPEIVIRSTLDGSCLWQLQETGDIQIEGTAAGIQNAKRLLVFSYGNDPILMLPDLPGEAFQQPLRMELLLKIDSLLPESAHLFRARSPS